MRNTAQIARCLLDSDGTTRDVTFTPVGTERLLSFLKSLLPDYRVVMARDADGNDIAWLFEAGPENDLLAAPSGYIHAVFEGNAQLIPVLQVFIDWPVNQRGCGLELSFFPGDLDRQSFNVDAFVTLIETWRSILGADDYFVRYENASWDWYDADGLGVIYTGRQLRAARSR